MFFYVKKENHIMDIHEHQTKEILKRLYIEEAGIFGLILTKNCFKTKKEGNIIFSHKLLKDCEDLQ